MKDLRAQFKTLAQDEKPARTKVGLIAQIEAAQKEKPAAPQSGKTRGRKLFNWDAAPEGVKAHRPGTKRAHVVETLSGDGATFDEIAAHCDWDRRTAYEGIKLIHSLLGWGLREDPETGIITAYQAEKVA